MNPKTGKPNDFGLDVIQKEVKRLQDRATTLQSKAIVRTDANVEKTGSMVDIIKYSTQDIQGILTKELRPVIDETRSLVQETLWKMDLYAKTTRADIETVGSVSQESEFNPYAKTTRADIETVGFISHRLECHEFPVGTYIIFGKYIAFVVLRRELSATEIFFARRSSSISPKQWEGINCHLYKARSRNCNENRYFWGERHADDECLQNLAMDPSTTIMVMLLYWSPQGKAPIKYDLTTNTDISNN